jgi:exopolysaccharide biosynthesis polyprenyl glycosylphosphotransferase
LYDTDKVSVLEGVTQVPPNVEPQGIRRRQRPSPTMWRLTLMVGDSVLLLASLALLLMLAPHFHLGLHVSWDEPGTWELKLIWGCIALVSWSIAVSITRAQDLVHTTNPFRSTFKVLIALILMLVFWIAFTYPLIADRFASHAVILLLFVIIAAPILIIWRVALAGFMSFPRFRPQVVIVGTNVAGQIMARELCSAKRYSVNVLGYIGESPDESSQKDGLPILGGRNTLRSLAQSGLIDMIVMSIDYKTNPALFQEAMEAAQLNIAVIPMITAYERTSSRIPVEHIGDQWYLALPSEVVVSPLYLCWRKALDITIGLLGLVAILLILPVIALLIYLDCPGPIFYSQKRLGYRGRNFRMYKFRSMRPDAEREGSAVWATEHDKRVTRVGQFLRATHLDELPQVLNILRGEMSLIGPRPERREFVTELEKTIPFYRCRLMVKPGLTGWAQVEYRYGSTNYDALVKLQYDLYYIKHQSMALDISIMLKTVPAVLFGRGT